MERNLFLDMEKITIYLGAAIIGLGIWNATGAAKISPALVTGISASGLCLTIADFLSKQYNNSDNKILTFFDHLLYILATMCLLVYPNSKFITSLDEDILNSISTTASLVALGFVFVTIGFSNKKAVLDREKKRLEEEQKILERMQEILKNNQKLSEKEEEQQEKTMKLLADMSMVIENLGKEVSELKNNNKKISV